MRIRTAAAGFVLAIIAIVGLSAPAMADDSNVNIQICGGQVSAGLTLPEIGGVSANAEATCGRLDLGVDGPW